MVLFSEGFAISDRTSESWGLMQRVVRRAERARVRIYSLDARGLARGLSQFQAQIAGDAPGPDAADPADRGSRGELDVLNSLAADTGGELIVGYNDFTEPLSRVANEARRYYLLGFAMPADVTPGSYRRLSVRVRRPDVIVRARRGYVP